MRDRERNELNNLLYRMTHNSYTRQICAPVVECGCVYGLCKDTRQNWMSKPFLKRIGTKNKMKAVSRHEKIHNEIEENGFRCFLPRSKELLYIIASILETICKALEIVLKFLSRQEQIKILSTRETLNNSIGSWNVFYFFRQMPLRVCGISQNDEM